MTNQLTSEDNSKISRLVSMLKGSNKEYVISQIITVIFFVVFAIADALISIKNNLYGDAVVISIICLIQSFTILVFRNKNIKYLNPKNIFFITCVALFCMCRFSGFSAGSVLYYFPACMVYFASTVFTNSKKRFRHFIGVTLAFTAASLINYFFLHQQNLLPLENGLKAYRLFSAIVLTAILVKNLFVLQSYLQKTDSRNEYHQALFQSYLDAYIVFNQETKEITDYNKRMLSLFDLPKEVELKKLYINQLMMRYLADDSANMELMMDHVPDNWHGEASFNTHNKVKFYSYVKSVVFFRDGNKYQILSIRDITSMKEAERELKIYKESVEKAGRAKARFLSSMSHELRTPLNGIIGTSNLIKSEPNLPEAIEQHIDVLLYSSEHMLGIINEILDFSKIDAGKLELKKQTFNVQECINNLAGTFTTQFKNKDLQLIIDQSADIEHIYVNSDEIKLTQVLVNLLSNALKFTLHGNVTLGVKLISTIEKNVTIQFEVKDTGIGIPPEKQAEIFQGFSQVHDADLSRRFGGTGLGLTISEKLVGLFGGKLEVESELGTGSRFHFTITFETTKKTLPAIEQLTTPKVHIDIRGIKILVVEDNEINAKILKSFLKKWEVQIKEAGNGVHALEVLKYHRFDLILMDLEMPEMDGYTAIKIIRQTDTTTPILAFTASLLENMDAFLAEAGFNGYVLKPYRPAELRAKIEMFAPHRKIEYSS
ncbi:MAG: response regulator [Ferruginibacter sp.]